MIALLGLNNNRLTIADQRLQISDCTGASMPLTPEALEERLIEFAGSTVTEVRRVPRDLVTVHLVKQLLRSATSPAANYAEARSAESGRDFIHKMQVGLKELRETSVWLRLLARLARDQTKHGALIRECDQLISIFVRSIQTARRRLKGDLEEG